MGICTINFMEKSVLIFSFRNYKTYLNKDSMSKTKFLSNFMGTCTNYSLERGFLVISF